MPSFLLAKESFWYAIFHPNCTMSTATLKGEAFFSE